MTSTQTLHGIGDIVQVDPIIPNSQRWAGVVLRVTAVPGGQRKNVSAEPISGGPGVKGHPSIFIQPGHERWVGDPLAAFDAADAAAEATPTESLTLGSIIKLKSRPHGWYVIIGTSGAKWRAALLGGDGDRYVRNVTRASIERVLKQGEFTLNVTN